MNLSCVAVANSKRGHGKFYAWSTAVYIVWNHARPWEIPQLEVTSTHGPPYYYCIASMCLYIPLFMCVFARLYFTYKHDTIDNDATLLGVKQLTRVKNHLQLFSIITLNHLTAALFIAILMLYTL